MKLKSRQLKVIKIKKDLRYLFSKINWDCSFLDAKAITILNEVLGDINDLGEL